MIPFALRHPRILYALTLAWWGAMLLGTSLPGSAAPKLPLGDKLVHFTAYAGMGLLAALSLRVQRRAPRLAARPYRATLLAAGAYALLDELHQLMIPRRSFEAWDLLADVLGAAAGILIARVLAERGRAPAE
ncbi:MAG: VanZ family protein [Acidobacteria bacterium]|nr:VanZ family protein [Acidobacteriota bacterium]